MKPEGNGVTAADVARQAGVSKWTVIRAFKPDARIAQETKERVLSVARSLNYQPNLLARSLATNRTEQVAILVDDFENPYKLPTLRQLTARLQQEGLMGFLININKDFSREAALLNAQQRRVDSIVFFGAAYDPATISDQILNASDQPIYVLARESVSSPLPSVYTDPVHAVGALSAHIYARGYRNPVYVAGPERSQTAVGRRQQYRKFWSAHGISTLPEINAGAYDPQASKQAIRSYLATTPTDQRCDVMLCENDILAIGAIDTLRYELGLRVPEDIAVAGFDDISLAGMDAFSLTTYRQPYEEMVDRLVEMLVGRTPPDTTALQGEIVIRTST
ncbi:LacI family DNA-binding transcriptional regulator [Celeribacter sp.]|uniref:LacI family DNA-binding transcriptional regulator n=1 Tax=Celeribacter sp. TaxID=1890673 RepID=UPI003A9222A0